MSLERTKTELNQPKQSLSQKPFASKCFFFSTFYLEGNHGELLMASLQSLDTQDW